LTRTAVAVTAGNTFVMKVSEIDPGVPMMLAQLAKEAGLPDGALKNRHHEVAHGHAEAAARYPWP
jgi:malonate-semialdehyde dehydrogenase (acetylating) / methylmalonate-semialdehyde dehydrogenase